MTDANPYRDADGWWWKDAAGSGRGPYAECGEALRDLLRSEIKVLPPQKNLKIPAKAKGAEIAALWAKKHSYREIAAMLELTVGAVAGYCRREGLTREPLPGVPLLELKDRHCRWIVGTDPRPGMLKGLALYCGKRQVLGSYCEEHASICYPGDRRR